jgi:hypothetical protein
MSQFPGVAFLIPCFIIVRLPAAWCDSHEITFHVKARHSGDPLESLGIGVIIVAPELSESLENCQPSTIVSADTKRLWFLGISNMGDFTSLASNVKSKAGVDLTLVPLSV